MAYVGQSRMHGNGITSKVPLKKPTVRMALAKKNV